MPRKIAFIGVHNGGKDTLSHYFFTQLKMKGRTAYYIGEQAEQALIQGMPLNTPETQMWLMGKQIKEEMAAMNWGKREYIVCNRSVLDILPYSAGLPNYNELRTIAQAYLKFNRYYTIFQVHPFDTIEDDGVRSTDKQHQNIIHELFLKTMFDFGYSPLHLDQPSKEERMKALDYYIDIFARAPRGQ